MKAPTLLVGLATAALLTGCGSSLLTPNSNGYDTQGCVEDALRRVTEHELAAQAASEFSAACDEGDGPACSALGVIAEAGLVSRPDDPRARELYARACDLGNQRGCVNLGKLEERKGLGETNVVEIRRLFGLACEAGDPRGCAALGRSLSSGGLKEVDRAIELLGGACRAGAAEACFDLAELERRGEMPGKVALEHYVRACVGGDARACSRLDDDVVVAGATRAPGLAPRSGEASLADAGR